MKIISTSKHVFLNIILVNKPGQLKTDKEVAGGTDIGYSEERSASGGH